MIFLTSDPHFGHGNIIKYVSRPFDNVEEMDKTLIKNFNRVVGENDILYILGDFTMGGSHTKCMKYREQINCKHVHLILGNHDKRNMYYDYFESVQDYKELKMDGIKLCLSHYPFLSWNGKDRGSIMCHGHIHSNKRSNETNQWQGILRYDVGVDANDYEPVSIEEIIKYFYSSKQNKDYINE